MVETTASPRMYPLQTYGMNFMTGHLTDGTQVLIGLYYPEIVAVFFDEEGRYLRHLVRELSQETQALNCREPPRGRWWTNNTEWEELERWVAELGMSARTIAFQKFELLDYGLCVADLPDTFQEMIDNGEELDDDDKEFIEDWKERGTYVFVWYRDYDINREGEVEAT